jgi:hypothetical protein
MAWSQQLTFTPQLSTRDLELGLSLESTRDVRAHSESLSIPPSTRNTRRGNRFGRVVQLLSLLLSTAIGLVVGM